MSLWNSIFNTAKDHTFLKVFEWREEDGSTIIHKHPTRDAVVTNGSKLIVAEGQYGVFMKEGVYSEPFPPGTYDLATRTGAIWSFFQTIKYGLNQPYKGDVFFLSSRTFSDQKWGTPGKVSVPAPELGDGMTIDIGAFGSFDFHISDPLLFLRKVVGNRGGYTTSEIGKILKRDLASKFAETLNEMNMPIFKIAGQYSEIGDAMIERLNPRFQKSSGVTLTNFIIGNISLPEEVQKMRAQKASLRILGDDLDNNIKLQTSNAMMAMASRPGASNPAMDMGVGMAMSQMMANQFQQPQRPQYQQAAPPPPPAPPLHYHGPAGSRQGSAQELAQIISGNPNGNHQIYHQGAWKSWKQVPEIVQLIPPPPPAPPPADEVFYYNGPSGQSQIPVSQIVMNIKAAPSAEHKVWKNGFADWKLAKDVPEIASKLQVGPPPIGGGPPPIGGGPPPIG